MQARQEALAAWVKENLVIQVMNLTRLEKQENGILNFNNEFCLLHE